MIGRLAEYRHVNFTLLSFPSVLYFSFHDDFEDFIELVGVEVFDVLQGCHECGREQRGEH